MIDAIVHKFVIPLQYHVDRFANKRFYNFPYGKKPFANKEKYLSLWEEEKKLQYPKVEQIENSLGYELDQEWFHTLGLQTQVCIMRYNICYQHGKLLYAYLRNYLNSFEDRNITIVETGTARGFSTLCMAKALEDHQQRGRILTFDVIPNDKKMIWNCIADINNGPQSRMNLLKNYKGLIEDYIIFQQGDTRLTLKKIDLPRIHFAFFDAVHSYDYVMNDFEFVKNRQQKGDIIFFDDYTNIFPGVIKAADEICEKYNYTKEVVELNTENTYAIARKN